MMSKPTSQADVKVETAPATPTQAQSTTMPKPYDPMKTVDGMFKGSILRMAYAFQDPKNFGESTKVIISECTKKYQDALDDCEIQLLDAKWYLEQRLAENRAQREAKAKEADVAIAKRKHDEAAEKDTEMKADSPSKRTKLNEIPSPKSSAAAQDLSTPGDQSKATNSQQTSPSNQPRQVDPDTQSLAKPEEKKPSTPQPPPSSQPQTAQQPPQMKQPTDPPPASTDDYPRQTPNVTPAITNDEFTFESMFTDALGDGDGDDMDDMNIGLDDDPFGDSFGSNTLANDTSANTQSVPQGSTQTQPQPAQTTNTDSNPADNAFSSLLEGVEQFANQPDDTQKPNTNNGNSSNNNAFTADIDMGTNIFDSFLNDEFDVGSNNGNNDFGDFANDGEVNFDELFGD